MSITIEKNSNGATLVSKNLPVEEMDASELLELSGLLKSFVLDHADVFDERPVKKIDFRGKYFCVQVTDKLWFWEEFESGKWEPETFDVFDQFLDEKTVFLDVGGWIGSTFLYGSQLSKRSFAFEPDENAFGELSANVKLNSGAKWFSKAELVQAAVAPISGSVKLGFRQKRGDSMSSVLLGNDQNSSDVKSVNLAEFIRDHKLQNEKLFVKMDVEGFEYEIIPALTELIDSLSNAVFLVSLHPQFLLEKLQKEVPSGKLKTSMIRKAFFKKHRSLLKAFKGYDCSFINGKPFRARKELTKALITGQFSRDLVFKKLGPS